MTQYLLLDQAKNEPLYVKTTMKLLSRVDIESLSQENELAHESVKAVSLLTLSLNV